MVIKGYLDKTRLPDVNYLVGICPKCDAPIAIEEVERWSGVNARDVVEKSPLMSFAAQVAVVAVGVRDEA
jgi:hypothetical protein